MTIDSLNYAYVDLLKLDVEGHELEALLGAIDTIHESKPVVLIEEKLDGKQQATRLLQSWGMEHIGTFKHDRLFIWPGK